MKFKICQLLLLFVLCVISLHSFKLKNKKDKKAVIQYNQFNQSNIGMNQGSYTSQQSGMSGMSGMSSMGGMNQSSFSQNGSGTFSQNGPGTFSATGTGRSFTTDSNGRTIVNQNGTSTIQNGNGGFSQNGSGTFSQTGTGRSFTTDSNGRTIINQNGTSTIQNSSQGGNENKYWQQLFGVKSERPKSICDVDVTPKNNNDKNNKNEQNGISSSESGSVPFKKKNYRYNKPGFEDSAYLWDYLDELMRDKIISAFKNIWEKVSKVNSDSKVKNPYSLKNMLKYYAANGGANDINFDLEKENDTSKIIEVLKKFNKGISIDETVKGIKLDQLNQALQLLSLPAPSKLEALKILIDRYDFNGDGALSKEEFLYMVILEAKDKLNDKNLFADVCTGILDPMFDFFDCNHDGFITAEGIWTGLKDLRRPNSNEYNMYSCLSKEGKQPIRTTSVNDMVIKHHAIKTGALNQNEWRKAVLLGYWDRQVNGMKIFDGDENNKKESRWINKEKDKDCENY